MKRGRLATIVGVRLAVMFGFVMTAYAILEHQLNPAMSWRDLALTHGLHVVSLGALLYIALLIGFEHLVARPLRAINAHLYKVATGRLELLQPGAHCAEVEGIVDSVNLMVRRMRLGASDSDPHRTAAALRDIGARLRNSAPEASEAIVCAAAALDTLEPVFRPRAAAATAATCKHALSPS